MGNISKKLTFTILVLYMVNLCSMQIIRHYAKRGLQFGAAYCGLVFAKKAYETSDKDPHVPVVFLDNDSKKAFSSTYLLGTCVAKTMMIEAREASPEKKLSAITQSFYKHSDPTAPKKSQQGFNECTSWTSNCITQAVCKRFPKGSVYHGYPSSHYAYVNQNNQRDSLEDLINVFKEPRHSPSTLQILLLHVFQRSNLATDIWFKESQLSHIQAELTKNGIAPEIIQCRRLFGLPGSKQVCYVGRKV
jgi:hypothetical protein